MRLVSATLALALSGCAAPPEAPEDLSDLARYMVRELENPDRAVLVAGADNFAELLAAVDYDADTADRSTLPASLEPEDVAAYDRPPDTDLANTTDVTLFYASRHPVSAHAAFAAQEEQLPAEPTASAYERTFLEGAECFDEGDCVLRTTNQVTRENLLFSMTFTLLKDFRRIVTTDGRDALVSLAWTEEIFEAHVGTATLWQSWTLDVFVDHDDGAHRFRANWAETTFDPPIDENIARNTTRSAMQDAHEAGDDALD